jgi:hypothetical protein
MPKGIGYKSKAKIGLKKKKTNKKGVFAAASAAKKIRSRKARRKAILEALDK